MRNKIWIAYATDQLTILISIFVTLGLCTFYGIGKFSIASFLILCPMMIVTSVEGPIIWGSKQQEHLLSLRKSTATQFVFAFSISLVISISCILLALYFNRTHPMALISFPNNEHSTTLQTLEEGWGLVKLQIGICCLCNAVFHAVQACIRADSEKGSGLF